MLKTNAYLLYDENFISRYFLRKFFILENVFNI